MIRVPQFVSSHREFCVVNNNGQMTFKNPLNDLESLPIALATRLGLSYDFTKSAAREMKRPLHLTVISFHVKSMPETLFIVLLLIVLSNGEPMLYFIS